MCIRDRFLCMDRKGSPELNQSASCNCDSLSDSALTVSCKNSIGMEFELFDLIFWLMSFSHLSSVNDNLNWFGFYI